MSISRRSFVKGGVAAAAAIGAAGALTACGGSSSTNTNNTAAAAKETIKINDEVETLKTVLLGKDSKIACIIVATKEGYYAEEKLTLETQAVSGGFPEAMPALSNGSVDVLPFGSIPTCTYVGQGDDLVIFGGTVLNGSECVTLIENKDKYKKAEDFKGKKIACFRMETGHMVTKSWLRQQGLKIGKLEEGADVEFILLEGSAAEIAAVENGEVDMCFVNSGYGYNTIAPGKCAIAFQPQDLIGHDFPCCRQSTNRTAFEEKKSALVKFEIANLRAQYFVNSNHEKTVQDIMEYSGQPQDYVESITYGKNGYVAAMQFEMDPMTDAVKSFYSDMIDNGDIQDTNKDLIVSHLDSTIYKTALDTLIARTTDSAEKKYYNELLEIYKKNNTLGV